MFGVPRTTDSLVSLIMPPAIEKGVTSIGFVHLAVCPSVSVKCPCNVIHDSVTLIFTFLIIIIIIIIANNSRTQRPSVPKFGMKVPPP